MPTRPATLLPILLIGILTALTHPTLAAPDPWQQSSDAAAKAFAAGDYTQAETLFTAALKLAQQATLEAARLAISLQNLADTYRAQGKRQPAEPVYQKAILIREKVLGANHPDLVPSLTGLAKCYRGQRKFDAAEPLYKRAVSILQTS